MASGRVFKLNTGATIPCVGLGTWQSKPNEVYEAVLTAIKTGYRHIDTAFVYQNEKEVGQAIKDSGVPREQLFVTTKLWNTSHRPDLVAKALETSLANLQMDYLDLYLMHWPVSFAESKDIVPKDESGNILFDDTDFTETYAVMEKLDGKKVRAIGVSNFSVRNLKKLLNTAKVVPAVNQVELHPFLAQKALVDFCAERGIHMTAYSPLGSTDSPLMKDSTVAEIAKKYDATPARILLSWGVQRGTSVIPKSVTASRIVENFKDVVLEQADFDKLNSLVTESKRLIIPTSWDREEFIFGEDQ
ncbi:NADP-dependent oxidoreductase domain-containing protein [Zychaea mexicana]|uniref:NADP-dependent oxidoreductase domain-containing protein n=1 Tax=Zychaea mexicana TaxID=64656 RepID=UPI0022FED86F|nr:NADP-dependent oxidoreductase domain-containing protein [Zychaea mexicana]KAI9495456.1 NADP-dependent oxidoreductase domain-containing protein [Zychaea mexicana]